jgi:hypothetical protein
MNIPRSDSPSDPEEPIRRRLLNNSQPKNKPHILPQPSPSIGTKIMNFLAPHPKKDKNSDSPSYNNSPLITHDHENPRKAKDFTKHTKQPNILENGWNNMKRKANILKERTNNEYLPRFEDFKYRVNRENTGLLEKTGAYTIGATKLLGQGVDKYHKSLIGGAVLGGLGYLGYKGVRSIGNKLYSGAKSLYNKFNKPRNMISHSESPNPEIIPPKQEPIPTKSEDLQTPGNQNEYIRDSIMKIISYKCPHLLLETQLLRFLREEKLIRIIISILVN